METHDHTRQIGDVPTLHLVCGKIASGKSTLTRTLAAAPKTVAISEDEWLNRLYPGEIEALADYVRCTCRLRDAMSGHIEQLLRLGLSVVLDFPANTRGSRKWLRELIERSQSAHYLHYLDVSDEECKARLRLRNETGTHEFKTSEAEFEEITRHFVPPSEDEGFIIVTYR